MKFKAALLVLAVLVMSCLSVYTIIVYNPVTLSTVKK